MHENNRLFSDDGDEDKGVGANNAKVSGAVVSVEFYPNGVPDTAV